MNKIVTDAWLINHSLGKTLGDDGYLAHETVSSPDGNGKVTAFEWGYGPVRVSNCSTLFELKH